MFDNNLGKTRFLVDSRDTCDHLDEASMITIKYRKGPDGGSIGLQTSTCRRSKNLGMEYVYCFLCGWADDQFAL